MNIIENIENTCRRLHFCFCMRAQVSERLSNLQWQAFEAATFAGAGAGACARA